MTRALLVFSVRESFSIPYSCPIIDILSDGGASLDLAPAAPMITRMIEGTIFFQSSVGATSYEIYRRAEGNDWETPLVYTSSAQGELNVVSVLFELGAYYKIVAVNAAGRSVPSSVFYLPLLTVWSPDPLPALQVGIAFSQQITVSGPRTSSFITVDLPLPDGLFLVGDINGFTLSGTPTTAGAYSITFHATHDDGTDDHTYTGTIAP